MQFYSLGSTLGTLCVRAKPPQVQLNLQYLKIGYWGRSRLKWRSALVGREFWSKTRLLEATAGMTDKMKKRKKKKKPAAGEWPADLQQSHALGQCVQSPPWPLKMKVDSEEHIQREEEHWMRWVSSRRELEFKRKTTEAHKTFYWYITSALTAVREPHTIDSTCE